jgi:hypothetical protein
MNCFFSISSSVLNLMAHYPMGTTSANHADLLQYLLTSFVSTSQCLFIHYIDYLKAVEQEKRGSEKFTYGRHSGMKFCEIARIDPGYHEQYVLWQQKIER